jgi:hypothetical protein
MQAFHTDPMVLLHVTYVILMHQAYCCLATAITHIYSSALLWFVTMHVVMYGEVQGTVHY